ncbi:uncharacterized protein LOC128258456 isoform X1 [Drosophila gunungcola]|uniref:uncharacterized protein LOC128258456 isoform X1 n=1 Tax=Drosophila gunungcola TaxID=103775 RepID=UPI0022E6C1E8|nr:uncharacterized protein LOC128258456 isoform X1 [Drosophila gunungcola]
MECSSNLLWFFQIFLLTTKVYTALSTPLPGKSGAYNKAAAENESGKAKVSNYFLHEPYGPNTYAFGYEVDDPQTKNSQFREEKRFVNGSIQGSYGYARPDGRIEVTKYRANEDGGYSAQIETFKAGDERVRAVWPTERPDILVERSKTESPSNVTWDPKSHLNVSVSHVADHVAQQLKEQHGLDLNHIDVTKDLLKPAVLDVIQGKAPAKGLPVQNLIPQQFPIVPFQLPADQTTAKATTAEPQKTESSKYNRAKTNNAEKAPQVEETEASLPPPRPLVNSSPSAANWQQRTIEANRREFLANLPNLSEARLE